MNLGVFISWLIAISVIAFSAFYAATRGPLSAEGWTYPELITVLLTAVTVVLAVLGLGIAVIAIWGYDRIERSASAAAVTAAKSMIESHLRSDEFTGKIREIVEGLPKSEAFEGLKPGEGAINGNDNGEKPFESAPSDPRSGG